MKQELTIGFSPCPNDCFIFDALIHHKIDTGNYEFIPVIEDVETLNQLALKGKLDITKLSYHAYLHVKHCYTLLSSGSALGFGCGPLLVTHSKEIAQLFEDKNIEQISKLKTLIPGELTTANFLLKTFYPELQNKTTIIFNEIENALLNKTADVGAIIHENRFTYQQKGLIKICDLGEKWEQSTNLPIPLGGIMAKTSLGSSVIQDIEQYIKKSVEYAFANKASVMPFVKQHASEMSEEVMQAHINLYVNDFSINLGKVGIEAINTFLQKGESFQ